jgi:hypothetical protein
MTRRTRAQAEAKLLALSSARRPTTVLNLCGLWGGARNPRNWLVRVAPSKSTVTAKVALYIVHGEDVARRARGSRRTRITSGER